MCDSTEQSPYQNHAGERLLNDIKTIHSHQQLPAAIPAASHPQLYPGSAKLKKSARHRYTGKSMTSGCEVFKTEGLFHDECNGRSMNFAFASEL